MAERKSNQYELYPEIEIGCLNTRAHKTHDVVSFTIPAGKKNGLCPECGRRAGRK